MKFKVLLILTVILANSFVWFIPIKASAPSDSAGVDKEPVVASVQAIPEPQTVEAVSLPVINETRAVAPPVMPSGSCADWMTQAGITDFANASWIIQRESGCNPNAVNPNGGACGIAQELPCGKSGCGLGNPVCQLIWMQNYVNVRYGGWAGAVAWWSSHNWY